MTVRTVAVGSPQVNPTLSQLSARCGGYAWSRTSTACCSVTVAPVGVFVGAASVDWGAAVVSILLWCPIGRQCCQSVVRYVQVGYRYIDSPQTGVIVFEETTSLFIQG